MKSFQVAEFNAPLKEVDQDTPQPTGTQVLIRVKAAGVCHSDLHIWEGGYDLGHGRKPLSLKDRGVSLPRTMGHETVGEVVAFGPDVSSADKGDLKVGDVALVYPWLGCGKCQTCLGGDENMCVVKPNSLGVYSPRFWKRPADFASRRSIVSLKPFLHPSRPRRASPRALHRSKVEQSRNWRARRSPI